MAVSLYTTPTCSYCRKAKQYFRENRISFKEYNVAKDLRRADEMMKKSGQMGVPVIDIHGKVIVGFNQSEIEKALKR
ncbi:MAG: glutathione S-transferase N-terminal domain-containing protein [Spirochaetales bacterium]|nr:glutathione S-transferase N-terminal domain-containing protein [Spirochaetales bacterium]MCF7938759.1 glutathione S-transferase N-terminal domain-containing protein [Spirochaetales bacterium]